MSDTSYAVYQHYGTAAQRAAFTPSPPGSGQPIYLWYETDTGDVYLYDTSWHLISTAIAGGARSIGVTIDGGGNVITTGIKADIYIPFTGTISAATLLADQSGDIVIDIWKDTYANYPPTDADSITASAPPTLSSAAKSQDTTLTGWTTSVAAGDTVRFNVDSVATVTRVNLVLTIS